MRERGTFSESPREGKPMLFNTILLGTVSYDCLLPIWYMEERSSREFRPFGCSCTHCCQVFVQCLDPKKSAKSYFVFVNLFGRREKALGLEKFCNSREYVGFFSEHWPQKLPTFLYKISFKFFTSICVGDGTCGRTDQYLI